MNTMDGNVVLTEEQMEVVYKVRDVLIDMFDAVWEVVNKFLDSFAEYCNEHMDRIIYYGKLELLNDFMNEYELINERNMIDERD